MLETTDVRALIATCQAWHRHARETPPRWFGGLATRVGREPNNHATVWFATSKCRHCPDHATGVLVLEKGAPATRVKLCARWAPGFERYTRYLQVTLSPLLQQQLDQPGYIVDCVIHDAGGSSSKAIHKHGRLHPDTTNDDMVMERVPPMIKFTNVPGSLECTYSPNTRTIEFRDKLHPDLFIRVGASQERLAPPFSHTSLKS